jgi:hypothetical protein
MFDPSTLREETDVGEFEYVIGPSSKTIVWRYSTYGSTPISGKAVANVLDVLYMPFRTMDEDASNVDYEMPMLKGLLLLPKGNKPGEYRRVGQFEISEHWWRNSIAPFTNPRRCSPQSAMFLSARVANIQSRSFDVVERTFFVHGHVQGYKHWGYLDRYS